MIHPEPVKTVYFIRHGEDEQGKAQLFQDAQSPLTEHGKRQARLVAAWAKRFNAERILTSPMQRALATARAIQEETGLVLEEVDIVREYLAPADFLGTPRLGEASVAYAAEMLANIHDPSWRYADEENYFDMHTRAMDTLGLLAGHDAGRLIVVTHAGFMRALLVAMMTDGEPDPTLAVMLMRFLKPKNTGITEVHWNPEAGWRNPWRLVTLNETTHLTEAGDTDDNSAQALPV